MSEQKYNIVLSGELMKDADKNRALEGLANLFKVDRDKATRMFDSAPVTVKKNIDKLTAEKYVKAFNKCGLVSTYKGVGNEAMETEAESSSTTSSKNQAAETGTEDTVVKNEKHPGLDYTIEGRPDYSYLTVQIPADETLKVEASAMATMDTNIKMKTRLKGGFKRFLSGESLFINEFTAEKGRGEIGIAPGPPGDLMHQYLDGDTLFLQNSAYVASTMGLELETKWQGMVKGFFSGESLFLIRCSGVGDLWFNTYGAIIEIDVASDYVVDTGNIVAFTDGLDYNITKVGGYKSLFFSGEGFVCRFSGKGKVWIQTRSASAFTSWAHYFRPVASKG